VSPAVPVVLARHAARLRPLLQKAGLVDDEDAACVVAQVPDDVVPEVVADAVGVPGGGAQQALHAPRPGLAHRFGELPPVLALHPIEQPRQVTPRPLPRFGAGEPVGDPRVQVRQRVPAPRDRRQPRHANHRIRPLSSGQRG
jgi:hypothetical protein